MSSTIIRGSTKKHAADVDVMLERLKSGEIGNSNFRILANSLTKNVQKTVRGWRSTNKHVGADEDRPFQVLDFFCGCGGMSLGFAAFSKLIPILEIVGGCDIENDALATFERNIHAPGRNIDIRNLAESESNLADFLHSLPRYDGKRKTIIIGCAPCQGFSSHRKRNWEKEDNRNNLIGAFASVAVKLNPECIIMENVPEMLSHKYWDHFEEARTIFEKAGYIVLQSIYNVASFGVPQDRYRALVIAAKKPFLLPKPLLLSPSHFKTVRSAIGSLPHVDAGQAHPKDPLHRSAAHRKSTLRTIRAVPKDGGSRPVGIGPKCLDRIKGFYDVYGRLAWDKPAITITHYARNPASGRYVHPDQDRGLTGREAALLQSFPNGFEFSGTFDSIFKQIGEAVPPFFASAIAVNCMIELLSCAPASDEFRQSITSITSPVSNSFSSVIAGMKMARNKI